MLRILGIKDDLAFMFKSSLKRHRQVGIYLFPCLPTVFRRKKPRIFVPNIPGIQGSVTIFLSFGWTVTNWVCCSSTLFHVFPASVLFQRCESKVQCSFPSPFVATTRSE